jgi:DNA-binding XRE family transcriptional regulator
LATLCQDICHEYLRKIQKDELKARYLDKYNDNHYTVGIPRKKGVTAMANIRDLREEALLSRKTLADKAKVSESTIVRIEDGQHRTQQEVVDKLLKVLSKELGRNINIKDVEGLQFYNVMRDRRNRRKAVTP